MLCDPNWTRIMLLPKKPTPESGGEGAFRRRPALDALVVGRFGLFKGL